MAIQSCCWYNCGVLTYSPNRFILFFKSFNLLLYHLLQIDCIDNMRCFYRSDNIIWFDRPKIPID
jgi:hypothetical protein